MVWPERILRVGQHQGPYKATTISSNITGMAILSCQRVLIDGASLSHLRRRHDEKKKARREPGLKDLRES